MSLEQVTQAGDIASGTTVEDECDVVVIGTGAGGATAARVLAEAGLEVVLIEEGPFLTAADLRHDVYTSFQRGWRDMGLQAARGRALTPVLQGKMVGGTTAVNGAIIHRLPEEIHDHWCRHFGVGVALPYAELDRVFDRLDAELSVGEPPHAIFGHNNALMERAVDAEGMTGNRVRRNVSDCQGSAHCLQGCPTARRQSMNVSYIPRALREGARLYATCRAERLIVDGGRAVGVEGRFCDPPAGRRQSTLRVRARRAVVLAASAIQTPLFLLDNGIGRRSRLVGRRLQAHPATAVVGFFDEPVRMWFGATQGYETTQFWHEHMKLETVAMPLELTAARLPGYGPPFARSLAEYDHLAIWGVQIRARAHGRVHRGMLGKPSIRFDPSDADVRTLKLGVKRLVKLMFAAGARAVSPGVFGLPHRIGTVDESDAIDALSDDPRRFHCIISHVFGTATMGADPATSVVAPDGQSHEIPGLYVADASVFPTNIGVNPQHTICAIAWLIAERLASTSAEG